MSNYIKQTDVAKLVRKELAAKFPRVKFGVKSTRGNSIDVHWTDGPTWDEVKSVAQHFHGTDFDGMTDSASSNGRPYGNDYIFFNRDHSDAALLASVKWYKETYRDDRLYEFVPSTARCQSYVRTAFYEIEERIYQHMREQRYYLKFVDSEPESAQAQPVTSFENVITAKMAEVTARQDDEYGPITC